ncbi:MAG: type II toxin-antitoxin system HicA family toxin [Heliobacteriaceae bacterium]|jgi:predicted RNA binding protein YcfA (HicA-like mRNA interferase family)|nr:type II toxin-antitoxin system HicA family toxin [Heliobacteriaceae bacterium]
MSKTDKIIEKMKTSSYGHKFEDCQKVLISLGFTMKEGKGSHFKFHHQLMYITIAKHRPVSPAAVKDVLNACEKIRGTKND